MKQWNLFVIINLLFYMAITQYMSQLLERQHFTAKMSPFWRFWHLCNDNSAYAAIASCAPSPRQGAINLCRGSDIGRGTLLLYLVVCRWRCVRGLWDNYITGVQVSHQYQAASLVKMMSADLRLVTCWLDCSNSPDKCQEMWLILLIKSRGKRVVYCCDYIAEGGSKYM